MPNKKRILIAPLDWGLGHATRCIPIIHHFILLQTEVIIAADGKIKNLLQAEFPQVHFIKLKGYNIRYSHAGFMLPLKLLLQVPKLFWHVYTEHQWLKKIIKTYKIDAVVSDNRLGLFTNTKPCVYITHQLSLKTKHRFTQWIAQKIHYFFINKYSVCWIPDTASKHNLAGELSHPKKFPKITVCYLGPLSRFEKINTEKIYDLLVLLSGPEPQRSIFEKLLLNQLKTFTGKAALVKGLPLQNENDLLYFDDKNKIMMAHHLSAEALNKLMQQSSVIIARSGYTTIMDVVKTQQKALLVPTPGQTEQEYLAQYLMQQNIIVSATQNNFLLQEALQKAACFNYKNFYTNPEEYKIILTLFVESLGKKNF